MKVGHIRDYIGSIIGIISADSRIFDYSSFGVFVAAQSLMVEKTNAFLVPQCRTRFLPAELLRSSHIEAIVMDHVWNLPELTEPLCHHSFRFIFQILSHLIFFIEVVSLNPTKFVCSP